MKNNLIWGLVHVDDTQHMYIVYEFFVDLRLSTGLLFSMSVALTWVSHLVLDFSDKTIPCLETPGISTIALIALWCVPIALWLSPNSYNVCKKSRTWLTVGWWGLRCRLLQKSSHRRTGVLYADCVLTLHKIWWSGRRQVTVPLLGGAWQNCCYQTELIPDWAL